MYLGKHDTIIRRIKGSHKKFYRSRIKATRGLKTAGIQIGTFFAYLWVLAKAKKQGACPYFQFTDKPQK